MLEKTGDRVFDTLERGGRNAPIATKPEVDVIQIHTGDKMSQGRNLESKIRQPKKKQTSTVDTVV